MRKLSINNLKIRTKLLAVYVFCVLLPIILTDAIILTTENNNSIENRKTDLRHVIERVEYNLIETINGCILFTSNLYTDRLLDRFLNKKYENYLDYYDNYTNLLQNNSLSYSHNYGKLYKIQIIADNDTLINGGAIATLDRVKNEEWYKTYQESGVNIFLYTYYDKSKKDNIGSGTSRTISIMRKLDNYGNQDMNKLLKIDVDYNLLLQHVLNEKLDGEIYVRNKDYILFSNRPSNSSMREFARADSIDEEQAAMSKIFTVGGQEWEILIVAKDVAFWDVILKNKGLIVLILLNVLIPTALIYYIGRSISKRISTVADYMGKVKEERFEVISCKEGEDEIGKLIRTYNLMILKIKNLIEVVFKGNAEKQALELSKKHAELKAIQSQVNPHFLFNTLETIRMRSLIKKEDETADIIGELALLLRRSMNWGADFVTIEEEMSFVEKYINIQKYRFGDKIKYNSHIMEKCRYYRVPKLSIGTFVENACIHGVEASVSEGIISVTITQDNEYLLIEISDNGTGFEKHNLEELRDMLSHADHKTLNESKNTGMINAYLRLSMYCEGRMIFHIDSELEKGTEIRIQMPLSCVIEDKEQGPKSNKEES
jgi:two-component system sensor histidine kinase YesM